MAGFRTLDDWADDKLSLEGKGVLLRVDFNVPMKDGKITDSTRIERVLPTINELRARRARVLLLSHFGRPKGAARPEFSLAPLAPALEAILDDTVVFIPDCQGAEAEAAVSALPPGGVALMENLRFHKGEETNDPDFAEALARLGDLYINDAFSAAHRAHASVAAITGLLPTAAGRAMQAELEHLEAALGSPKHPLGAVVGGAKVSTKLALLGNLVKKVDLLAIGGGMANTFLFAAGEDVGRSLCEQDMAETAREIMAAAKTSGCEIVLPSDGLVADHYGAGVASETVPVSAVPADKMILDLGPDTAADLARRLEGLATLVWNGPLGCFEVPPFDGATNAVARAAAALTRQGRLLTVAGGGDTVAALAHAGVENDFTYVSTAGGAFLEWLEGRDLPGVVALKAAAAR